MTPADQHVLREALAREVAPRAWQAADELRDWPDSEYRRAHLMHCGPSLEVADRIIAGPLAPYLAAEAENTRLKETVEAARAALEPFAEADQSHEPPDCDDDVLCWDVCLRIGDLRRARSVFNAIPPKEQP